MADVVILFALHRERMPFWRSFADRQRLAVPGLAWDCGRVQIVHGGYGPKRMSETLDWLLPRQPGVIVLAGFSGGLAPDLRVGDLVTASEIVTDDDILPVSFSPAGVRAGRIYAASEIRSLTAEKMSDYARTGSLAVDLESASVARRCQAAGISFGCLRAISDEAQQTLPHELPQITRGESIRPWRLLLGLIRRPGLLLDLIGLARATSLAARSLATGLNGWLRSSMPMEPTPPALLKQHLPSRCDR